MKLSSYSICKIIAIILLFNCHTGNAQIISTIAGNGTAGYTVDGVAATASELYHPSGVAVDGAGNVYIADLHNSRIRKVNSSGIISTIAGTGVGGHTGDGGPATAAQIGLPFGVAMDRFGNLYIADRFHYVRKINTLGIISTLAGTTSGGGFSGDGGPATDAQLYNPSGVAVDTSGNVYIADLTNQRIRKINTSGTISTVAGGGTVIVDGGPATATYLDMPIGVAVDSENNIYIANGYDVCKITPAGIFHIIAGGVGSGYTGDGGPAIAALVSAINGVAIDGHGYVYCSDLHRIRMINPLGIITTIAGSSTGLSGDGGDGGPATAALLANAYGVAVDAGGYL